MQLSRVLLEIGHGRNSRTGAFDPGAISRYGEEHRIVDRVARRIHADLSGTANFDVALVPDDLSLSGVIEWVNKNRKIGDYLLSLHMNSGGGSGVEVFYATNAHPLRRIQAAVLSAQIAQVLDRQDRGAKPDSDSARGRLAILQDTKCPAFLIELGFVDNSEDVDAVKKRGAQAAMEGIRKLRTLA